MDKHARGNAGLPPLTDHVDTDAPDTLLGRDMPDAPCVLGAPLEFDYADFVATVEPVGRIEVQDAGR